MKIVLDTNVLVSGLLKPFSSSGEIVRMITAESIQVCYDARILSEYRDVLVRPKFSFDHAHVDNFLTHLEGNGIAVASSPLAKSLPDHKDNPFLEVALAGNATYLVTGNIKHYPVNRRQGTKIVSPSDFIKVYRTN